LAYEEARYCLRAMKTLRAQGIGAELYPDAAKMKKQMTYANDRGFPFVAIVGADEMQQGKVTLKNMTTGEQTLVGIDDLAAELTK